MDKEKQLQEEEAKKVSGGIFDPKYCNCKKCGSRVPSEAAAKYGGLCFMCWKKSQ